MKFIITFMQKTKIIFLQNFSPIFKSAKIGTQIVKFVTIFEDIISKKF